MADPRTDRFLQRKLIVALSAMLPFMMSFAEEAKRELPEVSAGVMALPENQWVRIGDVPPDPLARELEPGRGAFLCYEPVSGKFLRYGGYTPTECNALWTYDLAARQWENPLPVEYAWPPPEHRPGAGPWWSMAYDRKRKVVWLYGGRGMVGRTHGKLIQDIWKYDPATGLFTVMNSENAPSHSSGSRIVYDSRKDLIIRAPGSDGSWANRHNRDRTWVYDPETNEWQGRSTPGAPKSKGLAVAWVFDPETGKTVYVQNQSSPPVSVTWTYDAVSNVWDKLETTASPPGTVTPGACYDPHNRLIVLYGGVGHPGKGYGYLYRGGGVQLHETWTLDVARAEWRKQNVGAPVIPELQGQKRKRFEIVTAMDYDTQMHAIVLAAPTMGVWALRLKTDEASPLPEAKLAALPAFDPASSPDEPIFEQAAPNKKLLELEPNTWVKLGGGPAIGGGEVPMTYDAATGYCLKYGGCNDGGTTFASGYGNDLCAYDPATERWIALRGTDPCGPPRPSNGCTRFYAYDPLRKVTWFAGGTAGNYLSSSLPADWKGGGGTWKYDGLKDRFALVPSKGRQPAPGVACCWDSDNGLFICNTKRDWGGATVNQFDPEQFVWDAGPEPRATSYTYGAYVPPLKGMLVVEGSKKDKALVYGATLLYDASKKTWRELNPDPELPNVKGRPTLAYDPESEVVICLIGSRTFVYDPAKNAWIDLKVPGPEKVSEMMCWDSRHNVILATHNMGVHMWAFRYKAE